jgi:hypothetical protein
MKRPGLSALGIILDMLPDPKDLAAAAVLSFAVALFLFLANVASVAVLVWRMG